MSTYEEALLELVRAAHVFRAAAAKVSAASVGVIGASADAAAAAAVDACRTILADASRAAPGLRDVYAVVPSLIVGR